MCDGFNHGALQIAVAQICQSMGWDALQKSTHDLLTDVLQKYLEEIAKSAHGYCQLYSRTEPNLDDLNQAFQDVGVCLHELEDFVSQVDQVPFIHQLPRFPKPKPCSLHHPRNGEFAERLEHYYDYLPPLVSKLLQNEDEEKAAREDTESADDAREQGPTEGFVRSEIKTVGEETSNSQVAVKRPHDSPLALENEAKKRRVELPFLQKANRGNEMDILDALQGNLSSPSPTPSPDIWSTGKTFELPPTSGPPQVTAANSAEIVAPSKSSKKTTVTEKKEVVAEKPLVKQEIVEPKSSPRKKVKASKNETSPVAKAASPVITSPPTHTKKESPFVVKSPLGKKKKPSTPKTPVKVKTKTTPKKGKKSADKLNTPEIKSPPSIKSPPTKKAPASRKENIAAKEGMPKLIIKPIIKKENNKEPQSSFPEFLPPGEVLKPENSEQKKTKAKDGTLKKKKTKKEKEGAVPVFKAEVSEPEAPSTSEGLQKFSLAEFAIAKPVAPAGEIYTEHGMEHKKKKKKRKEKEKDKEKKKEKSKKIKTDHTEPLQTSLFTAPPIPRITVKLEPPSQSTASASKATIKAETSAVSLGTTGNQVVGSSSPSSPRLSDKQEPVGVTSPAPKLTIKNEPLKRTVVAQTVSTTVVHGYSKEYFCPVCGDPDDGSFMIGCDGCDEWYHGRCVGILDDPGNDWFCSSCLAKKDKDSKDKPKKKKKKKSKDKGK